MESQTEPIQFEEFVTNTSSIFEKVEKEGKGVVVERDGELFSLKKIKKLNRPKTKTRTRRRGLTEDDSILNIIGIGSSKEPTDVAKYKHEYLAEAAADLHKE